MWSNHLNAMAQLLDDGILVPRLQTASPCRAPMAIHAPPWGELAHFALYTGKLDSFLPSSGRTDTCLDDYLLETGLGMAFPQGCLCEGQQ
ncbi:MAG TPA: hypothetical protein VME17_06615 [Bryobacteraceae bacterium]|nr:hypothetical protein [Bryobacteraceae bacterium]